MSDQILVSVIVPTYFSAEYLEECLLSIKNQSYKNIELVVVDANSSDGSQEIAKKYASVCFFGQAIERSAKRNFGALRGHGQYVLIADSDMILTPEVVESCVQTITSNKLLKAVVVPEKSIGNNFWSRCKALERSFYLGVEWMEAARFFDREAFLEVGGYDVNNTGSEDYDLPQRMKQRYGPGCIARASGFASQNEVSLSFVKSCAKKFYYSKSFIKYALNPANAENFKKQSSLILRYKLFLSQPTKLFRNPMLGIGMLILKTSEFVSGGAGYFWASLYKRQK